MLSRRAWLASLALALASGPARAALRIPHGGVLRLPLPAPRRTLDPARAVDLADAWPLGLVHECLATVQPDGAMAYPLLAYPPVVDRADPRNVTIALRPGLSFAAGQRIDAAAVVAAWRDGSASPLRRLLLAMCATAAPFEVRGDREVLVRLAAPGLQDEVLAAWPMAVTGPRGTGAGPFAPRGGDTAVLVRNGRCPTGAPFLERVELAPPRARNDEVRAFATNALDASWRGAGLYEVARAAQVVRGAAAAVVGLVPASRTLLDRADHARALERSLAALATGTDAPLSAMGFAPEGAAGDVGALAARVRAERPEGLRVAREAADGFLSGIAERVVALLDAARIPVVLVSPGEAADAALRAVAPIAADPGLALASFAAAAGDEAGASAVARTPRAGRGAVAAGVWGRGTAAVLGRCLPVLYLRAGVNDARFDVAGRLLLGDASVARGSRP